LQPGDFPLPQPDGRRHRGGCPAHHPEAGERPKLAAEKGERLKD